MIKTQLVEIDNKDLIKADWNYKTDGTDEQIEKLINSINEDKSVGVLAVREVNDKFEVIDGNHRLEAVKRLGWDKIPCENFGDISKAKAITIARRRNHKWFEDDIIAYAELFKDEILSEYSIEELEKFMPDSKEEMENLSELLDFNWDEFKESNLPDDDVEFKTINIKVTEEVYNNWLDWKQKCIKLTGHDSDLKCFEYAIVEAINTPEESINGTTEEI